MRRANRLGARFCFLIGENELTTDSVLIKDMDGGEQWTVPFGLGAGKIFKISDGQSVNVNVSAYYNAVRPTGAADWIFRVQWTFLFPQ